VKLSTFPQNSLQQQGHDIKKYRDCFDEGVLLVQIVDCKFDVGRKRPSTFGQQGKKGAFPTMRRLMLRFILCALAESE